MLVADGCGWAAPDVDPAPDVDRAPALVVLADEQPLGDGAELVPVTGGHVDDGLGVLVGRRMLLRHRAAAADRAVAICSFPAPTRSAASPASRTAPGVCRLPPRTRTFLAVKSVMGQFLAKFVMIAI